MHRTGTSSSILAFVSLLLLLAAPASAFLAAPASAFLPAPGALASLKQQSSILSARRAPASQASTTMSVEGSPLKVRSVTSFVSLPRGVCGDGAALAALLRRAVGVNGQMRAELEGAGYEVQTTRVAANPFGEWLSVGEPSKLDQELSTLRTTLEAANIDFFNCGPALDLEALGVVPKIITQVPCASASADLLPSRDLQRVDGAWMEAVAACCLDIARLTEGGIGNFRFCASAYTDSGVPFFPAAYHSAERPEGFALALENGGLVYSALAEARGKEPGVALEGVRSRLMSHLLEMEKRALKVAQAEGVAYLGVDTSVNPALSVDGSVAGACEKFYGEEYRFGHFGTLAMAEMLTRSVREMEGVRMTGYCGLMLPVLEDITLAQRTAEGLVSVGDLLRFSSVCGVGLDTVPISGFADRGTLARVYRDVAAMAVKLKKPLTVRLFPVPGRKEGEEVDLQSPYLCKSLILPLK